VITKYLITLIVILGLIVGLAYLVDQSPDEPNIQSRSIDQSIDQGLAFLAQAHTPYHYADAYLEYVYPGEQLECGLPECNITYRVLDAYFALTMLKEQLNFPDQEVIREQILESEVVYDDLVPRWQEARIYNTIKSTEEDRGGIALDTYCILGYLLEDKTMAQRALSYLDTSGEWLAEDAYPVDTWRNIADETWCLRLLAVTQEPHDSFDWQPNINTKIEQTREFISSDESANSKLGVLYHMLMLLSEPNVQVSQAIIKEFQKEVYTLEQTGAFDNDPVALANIIESLAISNYDPEVYIEKLSDRLIAMQNTDGSWTVGQQNYPVFSSFRALIALATLR